MDKIKKIKTISQIILVDNSSDAARDYDIKANVVVTNGAATTIPNGWVSREDNNLATFNRYDTNMMSCDFNTTDESQQIIAAINNFVENVFNEVHE